jgi:hypothetical protein
MNKTVIFLITLFILAGCNGRNKTVKRLPVAEVNNVVLYYDEIPDLIHHGINESDSIEIIHNYINKWAKREIVFKKAEENLTPELKINIERQLEETRANLVIYQYQRQMMLEKMDTVISEKELQDYYSSNEKSFTLSSNIIKALFIKLPLQTPQLDRIRILARSGEQKDIQQLESLCYQFAEKFDDFNEQWVSLNKLSVELPEDLENQKDYIRKNSFIEKHDSGSVYLVAVRDFRLRSSPAPFEYVRDDIKRIIWNTRRLEFIQSLENGIYNDALKKNSFKIY